MLPKRPFGAMRSALNRNRAGDAVNGSSPSLAMHSVSFTSVTVHFSPASSIFRPGSKSSRREIPEPVSTAKLIISSPCASASQPIVWPPQSRHHSFQLPSAHDTRMRPTISNPAPFHSPRVPIWKGLRSGGSSAITPIVSTFASRATTIEQQCSHTAKTAMDDWNLRARHIAGSRRGVATRRCA